ncbi:MAG: M4 family metallopeptidase [Actinomycetota bacterium]
MALPSGAVHAAGAPGTGLRPVVVHRSLLGTHQWFQQTYLGLPVLDGFVARHVDDTGRLLLVSDGRKRLDRAVGTRPSVSAAAAIRAAQVLAPTAARDVRLAVFAEGPARLVWSVVLMPTTGSVRVLVDARTGSVLRADRLARDATGTGRVFHPNPVATLCDQSLTDRSDKDYGALQPAYRSVTLKDLDTSGYLRGRYATIALDSGAAFSTKRSFQYNRRDDRFEQVMAYHDVTVAQRYIQSLGFDDINNEPQDLKPNAFGGDTSFYDPAEDSITLGTGGVDDAEDADVTWHEYGHAIHYAQVPGYGFGHDAGAIGEGFGDYWAATMTQSISGIRDIPCVADWDSVSYTNTRPHCLRRTDTDTTVRDQTGEIHHDGQLWSRALWDINRALGRTRADRIILEAQFAFCPVVLFSTAAQTTVNVAQRLYGQDAAAVVAEAFRDRGIVLLPEPPHIGCGVIPSLPV